MTDMTHRQNHAVKCPYRQGGRCDCGAAPGTIGKSLLRFEPEDERIPGYRITYAELERACKFLVGQGWAGGLTFDEAIQSLVVPEKISREDLRQAVVRIGARAQDPDRRRSLQVLADLIADELELT